jgi:hypothetical protein
MKKEQFVGKTDGELFGIDFANKRTETDAEVIKTGKENYRESEFFGRFYRTKKFPVMMPSGRPGVGAYNN